MSSEPLLTAAGLDEHELSDLLALVSATDVVELEVAFPGGTLRLRRLPTTPLDGARSEQPTSSPFLAVTSPLVGIFRPNVHAGEQVQLGQPLGAIEALGMPTSVDAPAAGSVEELLIADGRPVEYGQALLVLRLGTAP